MIADFKCDNCGVIAEYEIDARPVCCGDHMRKIYSAPAIQFVGDGFFVNDYKPKLKTEEV